MNKKAALNLMTSASFVAGGLFLMQQGNVVLYALGAINVIAWSMNLGLDGRDFVDSLRVKQVV